MHGFTLQYPANWYPFILSDVFCIEKFHPSKTVRAVGLPPGGAGIHVVVASQILREGQKMPQSVDDLATLDVAGKDVIGRRNLVIREGARALPVVEVKTRCCTAYPYREAVTWYFQFEGVLFAADVYYWEGDPNASKLVETLRQIVLSVRVVGR
jgi:hypothetical protein